MRFVLALASFALVSPWVLHEASAQQRASGAARPRPPASVETRAQQYWTKRAQRDLNGAYAFYCAAYKARVPLADYLKQTRLVRFELRDIRVTHTKPVGDRREVTIEYRFMAPNISADPIRGETTDVWAREANGTWCKVDEPLLLPFPSTSVPQTPRD